MLQHDVNSQIVSRILRIFFSVLLTFGSYMITNVWIWTHQILQFWSVHYAAYWQFICVSVNIYVISLILRIHSTYPQYICANRNILNTSLVLKIFYILHKQKLSEWKLISCSFNLKIFSTFDKQNHLWTFKNFFLSLPFKMFVTKPICLNVNMSGVSSVLKTFFPLHNKKSSVWM